MSPYFYSLATLLDEGEGERLLFDTMQDGSYDFLQQLANEDNQ